MFKLEPGRDIAYERRQTPSYWCQWPLRLTWTKVDTVVTQCSPRTHPLTEFFSSEWEFLVKLCFDRETGGARQGPVPGFVLENWLSQCIYANPLPCPAHTRLEEEGESKATLKTLSKNGKALFNFTNKIILKSLCQLFACDLIMEEYVTIYG